MTDLEAKALETAGRELMSKRYDPTTWALAIAAGEGNEDTARARYLELRVPLLVDYYSRDAIQRQVAQEAKSQRAEEKRAFREAEERARQAERERRSIERAKRRPLLMLGLGILLGLAIGLTVIWNTGQNEIQVE